MEDQWYPLDTLHINPLYTNGPFRSYHSSDEADAGSPGGGGFHPGHGSGRDFMGHGQSTPSFSAHGRLLVEDAPYLPPREAPVQFVSPASLHADNAHAQVRILVRKSVLKLNFVQ
jgi:hypothetical protein